MNRQGHTCCLKACTPGSDASSLKDELSNNGHTCIGPDREILLPQKRFVHPSGSMIFVDIQIAFWMTCDMQVGKGVSVKQLRFEELDRTVELAYRHSDATTQQQSLFHVGFTLVSGDPIFER